MEDELIELRERTKKLLDSLEAQISKNNAAKAHSGAGGSKSPRKWKREYESIEKKQEEIVSQHRIQSEAASSSSIDSAEGVKSSEAEIAKYVERISECLRDIEHEKDMQKRLKTEQKSLKLQIEILNQKEDAEETPKSSKSSKKGAKSAQEMEEALQQFSKDANDVLKELEDRLKVLKYCTYFEIFPIRTSI